MCIRDRAIWLVFVVRFEGWQLEEHLRYLPRFLPFFVAYAGLVYWFFSLYRSKWRFASLPDLSNIVKAVSVLTVSLLAVDYVLISPSSVSYTHLDVYKRQPLLWAQTRANQAEAMLQLARRNKDKALAQQALAQLMAATETAKQAPNSGGVAADLQKRLGACLLYTSRCV